MHHMRTPQVALLRSAEAQLPSDPMQTCSLPLKQSNKILDSLGLAERKKPPWSLPHEHAGMGDYQEIQKLMLSAS